jgi:NAD(P)-dependent dehydrogenase (short-subunit alcohol dehydrogenase family)
MDDSRRVWLITGCSSGLGRATADRALASGAGVFATARSVEKIADLQKKYPDSCWPLELDVTNRQAITKVFQSIRARSQRIDVVVNNSGYGLIGALEECSEEQVRRNFETIVFGAIHVMQAALPMMRAQRSGRIINISAAAAISNYPGFSIYGGAKFALEGISESLAAEVKPLGIKVTLVQPGPFRTEFISRSLERATISLEDYANTSGKFSTFLEKMDGHQPGDPNKAADAIIKIAESENPPLRVALGQYAVAKVERVLKSRQRELEAWTEVGLETDRKPEA